jgi:ubiquinone/menaquinone biosynthesis C-methylase UbiE
MNPEEYARMHALETDYWWFVGRRAIIGRLMDQIIDGEAVQLLDLGCGTGANLRFFCGHIGSGGRVTALDYSPLALDFAKQAIRDLPVSLLRGDALKLPFPDAGFDIVSMLDVLEHLRDDDVALREVHRVLRPGGHLVWSVPAYKKLWSRHDVALQHYRRYERLELQQLLKRHGFQIRRLSFAMSPMPAIAWAWRRLVLPFKKDVQTVENGEAAILPITPSLANRALIEYLRWESRRIIRKPLPWGTSLVGIARKEVY